MEAVDVFIPSTVFIDEVPANMMEYTAAKMAGEAVCQMLTRNHPEAIV